MGKRSAILWHKMGLGGLLGGIYSLSLAFYVVLLGFLLSRGLPSATQEISGFVTQKFFIFFIFGFSANALMGIWYQTETNGIDLSTANLYLMVTQWCIYFIGGHTFIYFDDMGTRLGKRIDNVRFALVCGESRGPMASPSDSNSSETILGVWSNIFSTISHGPIILGYLLFGYRPWVVMACRCYWVVRVGGIFHCRAHISGVDEDHSPRRNRPSGIIGQDGHARRAMGRLSYRQILGTLGSKCRFGGWCPIWRRFSGRQPSLLGCV